ncbi:MAG: hypothetical protein UY21_C0009G0106 [Microgenomates group bacterium GW2011_GWA1_48_10]|nr:MAG: hypothetical protein UY21_C0009G0106 [Microgenomates group bacterium GW2011_GWA1_48_10]
MINDVVLYYTLAVILTIIAAYILIFKFKIFKDLF